MKTCQKCGNEIDDKAVVCTQCGCSVKTQKPIFKKWWFWLIIVFVIIFSAAIASGDENSDNNSDDSITSSAISKTKSEAIKYEKVNLQTMLDDLSDNAMKAESAYQNKYVEVKGKIASFDSDGAYITIEPVNANEWNFETVMCNIKGEKQSEFLLNKSKGDTVTIKGKIKSIGEVLGYTLDIDKVS